MTKRSFTRFVEQELGKFPHFLIFALLEWTLIFLLLIDGFLAFVANEFAKFFELRIPCLLCTRIDHIIVHRDADFYYNDSVCETHKKDVSSLAYCHNHKKLSDIRKMCEACLLSFATEKESDCDTYKSLVGILHKDLECFVEDDHQILSLPAGRKDEAHQLEKSSIHCCSCCGEPLKVKNLSHSKLKNGGVFSQAPAPSPRADFVMLKNEGGRKLELPHIRYIELPEEDDGSNERNLLIQFKEDVKAATVPLLTEGEDLNDDVNKTPSFGRANKFFGIPLTDSANNSPRLGVRITRKSPLERTEFASENLDGTVVDGGNGDPILYSLKRQVRLDRKSLMALYMELDEERSASAVAANNAMAMITRLQAEKAAMQMEALQYQRMMEEQAEYDQEALQATNELLVKREEEIKALESELAAFREKYGYLKEFELKKSENDSDEENQETKSQSYLSCSTLLGINGKGIKDRSNNFDDQAVSIEEKSEGGVLDDSLKIVKDEKSYLRVKKVEKKSPISSDDGVHSVQSTSDSTNDGDEEIGEESKISLTGALYHLSEKVKALEADTGFLEHAAQIHEKHGEGTKILTEISRNLQKLQNLIAMPFEDIDA